MDEKLSQISDPSVLCGSISRAITKSSASQLVLTRQPRGRFCDACDKTKIASQFPVQRPPKRYGGA